MRRPYTVVPFPGSLQRPLQRLSNSLAVQLLPCLGKSPSALQSPLGVESGNLTKDKGVLSPLLPAARLLQESADGFLADDQILMFTKDVLQLPQPGNPALGRLPNVR